MRRVLTSLSVQSQEIGFISQLADATQPPDTIRGATNVTYWPTDIDRGDSLVLYYGPVGDDHNDVSVYNLRTKTSRRIMLPGLQKGGRFSPDGRWIAMESLDLAGRSEVVVQPWPALNARYTITGGQGGDHPVWSRDGRELYFRSGDAVMAVKVSAGSTWTPSAPTVLFSGPYARDAYGDQSFDVGPDGRFLMLREGSNARVQIRVIRNWSAELERRLPR
jgi:Tol biopolymer transport system component